ncbi:MAG: hypothetical protein IJW99_10725 [Clostridia bacterium]|nr:hypothetical protein [Clostridia bacterium]
MKRRDQIIQTVALLTGLIGLTVWCIRKGTWAHSLLISLGVVALYVPAMEISWRSSAALVALPYSAKPPYRLLIPLSLKIALPLYLCLFCVACIPLFRWELWLLTGFPVLLLLSAPLWSLMGELKDRRFPRRLFWAIQIPTVAAVYLLGQAVAWGLTRMLGL